MSMRHLKNHPTNATRDAGMHLSAVSDDDDELLRDSSTTADDTIQLTNDPDVVGIDRFWSGVQRDLKSDPSWYAFSDD